MHVGRQEPKRRHTVHIGLLLVVATCVVLWSVLPIMAAPADTSGVGGPVAAHAASEVRGASRSDDTTIGVYGYKFDPLRSEPVVAAALRIDETATAGPGLYLVQFVAPIDDLWLDQVRAAGLVPLQYYAHNAYLVWGTPSQVSTLRGESFLRWSGVFQPAYKINPDVAALAQQGKVENVAVTFYNDGAIERTLQQLAALGTYVQHFPAQPDRAFYTAILALDAGRLADAARISTVWAIDYVSPLPVLEDEIPNQILAGNFASEGVPSTGYQSWLAARGFDGTGITFADVDTGLDTNDNSTVHPDLQGRIAAFVDYTGGAYPTDLDGHGTHTAGIIAGNASLRITDTNGFLFGQGMAPNARLVVQNALWSSAWPPVGGWQQLSKDTVLNGALGSNNSWAVDAQATGSGYSDAARTHDLMVRDANFDTTSTAEPIIMVFSAGNKGPGASTITDPKEAKNLIVVGASENYRPSTPLPSTCGASSNIANVVGFSSRGPCIDGRLCPTIVAPGTAIASLRSYTGSYSGCGQIVSRHPEYVYMSGTSMAAPQVSGSVALIAQWWKSLHGGSVPSPAMVKALLIGGARDLGTADIPNNDEGWGRVDLENLIGSETAVLSFDQGTVFHNTGETWPLTVIPVDLNRPFKATLVWTDAAGGIGANPALVNDLDLTVVSGSQTYHGNVFSGGWSGAGGAADDLNNAENVFLPAGTGGEMQIIVSAANIAGDGVPYNGDATDQDFALVLYNARFVNAMFMPLVRR